MPLVGLILGAAFAALGTQAAQSCAPPEPAIYTYDYEAFDTDKGWRSWGARGCEEMAADIVAQYRQLNGPGLKPSDIAGLNWHEGQLRASVGDYDSAVALMTAVRDANIPGSQRDYYVATIAFLRSDYVGLVEARDRMRAQPEPDDFRRAADQYVTRYQLPRPTWPMNIEIVDDMVRCFGLPYREVYGGC